MTISHCFGYSSQLAANLSELKGLTGIFMGNYQADN